MGEVIREICYLTDASASCRLRALTKFSGFLSKMAAVLDEVGKSAEKLVDEEKENSVDEEDENSTVEAPKKKKKKKKKKKAGALFNCTLFVSVVVLFVGVYPSRIVLL